jgi:hypothetical protein
MQEHDLQIQHNDKCAVHMSTISFNSGGTDNSRIHDVHYCMSMCVFTANMLYTIALYDIQYQILPQASCSYIEVDTPITV